MKLRDYQTACISAIYKELTKTDKALVALPVGSGKTVIFTKLIEHVLEKKPNFRAIILLNRGVLIEQTKEKLTCPCGVYSAGYGSKDLRYPITIATVQSLANCKVIPRVDCIIVDEVHSLALDRGQGKTVYDKLGKPKVIGFTATPYYPDGAPLWGAEEFFKKPPCYTKTLRQMTDSGYLAPLTFAGQQDSDKIDFSNVSKTKFDFNTVDLEACIFDNYTKVRMQVYDIIKRTKSRKKVAVLCVSIKHAILVWNLLRRAEQGASLLHSRQPEQQQFMEKFNFTDGDNKFIVSVMMLSVGWDYPPLDALAICRPTRSKVLFMQAVGRIARKAMGKTDGLVLDYGDIIPNLGTPYNIRVGNTKKKKPPVKMCVSCLTFADSSMKKCPLCKAVFMLMCAECLNMKPYGERCACGSRRTIDPLKNLTIDPSGKKKPRVVSRVDIVEHIAKKTKSKLVRVDYYSRMLGFDERIVSEYLFDGRTVEQVEQHFKAPSHVVLGLNNKGYKCIKERYYNGLG
jgi:DNA repair protein RadD